MIPLPPSPTSGMPLSQWRDFPRLVFSSPLMYSKSGLPGHLPLRGIQMLQSRLRDPAFSPPPQYRAPTRIPRGRDMVQKSAGRREANGRRHAVQLCRSSARSSQAHKTTHCVAVGPDWLPGSRSRSHLGRPPTTSLWAVLLHLPLVSHCSLPVALLQPSRGSNL